MKLRLDQLAGSLSKELHKVYMVSGDEPLQVLEAMDAIKQSLRSKAYEDYELFYVESGFDWSSFTVSSKSFSLFSEKRILDIRLPQKPDKEGCKVLIDFAKNPPQDSVLIMSLPKLTQAEQKEAWFKALEAIGAFIQVWPLEGPKLLDWLSKRMTQKGMLADRSGLIILAARVEGNLLAAAQEIEKLHILYGATHIEDEMIRKAVADSARYDVYDLAEAAMAGQTTRAYRILAGLRAEGIASVLALWALTRDLRILADLKTMIAKGESQEAAFAKHRIYDTRKNSLSKAMQRLSLDDLYQAILLCGKVDRSIKGMENADPWDVMLDVCLSLKGNGLGFGCK